VTIAVWWAIGMAGVVVLARCLLGPVRRGAAVLARRRQAQRRAEALLLGWLSADQRRQYQARGWFEVTTARIHGQPFYSHGDLQYLEHGTGPLAAELDRLWQAKGTMKGGAARDAAGYDDAGWRACRRQRLSWRHAASAPAR
jgi:hypothetical protein